MEFVTGNSFGFCAFTTYGGFWISLVLMLNNKDVTERDKALFFIVFVIFTFIMLVASSSQNVALLFVFFVTFLGLLFSVLSHFFPENMSLRTAGASFLLLAALGAFYIMAHLLYFDAFKQNLFPVGLPVQKWKIGRG